MQMRRHPRGSFKPSLQFVLLLLFLGVVWLAGGASRADVVGQVVVRASAWASLMIAILFVDRAAWAFPRPVLIIMLATVALACLQLVPLPPAIWQALPSRDLLIQAGTLSDGIQPWRPWSIVPDATLNALSSLVVPFTAMILVCALKDDERRWLPGLVLGLITATMLVGLLQFSGAGFDSPLINDTIGDVSGTFANRNHFALFLAVGCVLAPVWCFSNRHPALWRVLSAFSLILLFTLMVLASGSRAGIALVVIALGIGMALTFHGIRRALGRYSRWVSIAFIAGALTLVGSVVWLSIAADRAVSVERALTLETGEDLRSRALPTVLEMVRAYFPAGSGLGGFDPIFRIYEPFDFLSLKYFNHAHNDFLEIILDAGIAGLAILVGAVGWWLFASWRVWRSGIGGRDTVQKTGSAVLLLVLLASAVDYPARTPIVMVLIVIAGIWLAEQPGDEGWAALPQRDQRL